MAKPETHKPIPEDPAERDVILSGLFLMLARNDQYLRHQASHDQLTGLLNKEAVKQQARERIEAGRPFGVVLMDWDAFKAINDTLGHERADEMLEAFGKHMNHKFKREGEAFAREPKIREPEADREPEYLLGRYGGDEFVGIVNLDDRKRHDGLNPIVRMDKAEGYMRSVLAEFVETQDQDVRDLQFNISLGGAVWEPGSNQTASDLFKAADHAMFEDKRAHKAPVR